MTTPHRITVGEELRTADELKTLRSGGTGTGGGGGVSASADNTWTGTQSFTGASTPGLARLAGGNTFTGAQDFTGATTPGVARLSGNTFTGAQDFTSATTPGLARLAGGNTFTGAQDFTGATTSGLARLSGNTFTGTQDFSGATTPGVARLAGNTFTGTQDFTGATTPGVARLAGGNTFTGTQDFSGATMTGISGTTKAWQFAPETYGAKGDGRLIGDLATTNGSAVVTSATAAFNAGDVGKAIMINGAIGAANIALMTTIASRQSATQVTLSAAATVTATGLSAIYGTDDTVAIQAAVDAASTYAQANEYYGEVVFQDRYYIIATAPTPVTTNPAHYNAQIKLPYPTTNTVRKLVIALTGAGDASHLQFWGSTVPALAGTCLVSMRSAPATIDATLGPEAVLGGPNGHSTFANNFANAKIIMHNLSIWCTPYTNQTAVELSWYGGCRIDGCSVHVFAQPLAGNGSLLGTVRHDAVFASRVGVGLRLPVIGNNADVWIGSLTVEGVTTGLRAAEHVRIGNLKTLYNDVALIIDTTDGLSGKAHGVNILGWTAEAYNGGIRALGSGPVPVSIWVNTEDSGSVYDVRDDSGALRGEIHWSDSVDARDPVVTGATKVKIVNDNNGPGQWASQPAIPASTVARQNTAWRDAMVVISGGTGVTIAIDGTTLTGVTSGAVMVPSGKNITLTYTTAPTWTWWLL